MTKEPIVIVDPGGSFLLRFIDGPMATKHNISTLAGTSGNMAIKQEVFGWPLPERLGILTHEGVDKVAMWNADDPTEGGLPPEIIESPNAVIYKRFSMSELAEDVPGVVRGAEYQLEEP